jgi:hypothetical protein
VIVRVFVRLVVLILIAWLPIDAHAASCRGYSQHIRASIKKHVDALRALEHEAADRLKGLDTRTFEYLLVQARGTAAAIGDEDALAKEDGLGRCRDGGPPVRRTCAEAARALVSVIEEQAAGAASKAAKQSYAEAMPRCERLMNVTPLATVFRASD